MARGRLGRGLKNCLGAAVRQSHGGILRNVRVKSEGRVKNVHFKMRVGEAFGSYLDEGA